MVKISKGHLKFYLRWCGWNTLVALKRGLLVCVLSVVFDLETVNEGRLLFNRILKGCSFQITRRLSDRLILVYLLVNLYNFLRQSGRRTWFRTNFRPQLRKLKLSGLSYPLSKFHFVCLSLNKIRSFMVFLVYTLLVVSRGRSQNLIYSPSEINHFLF